jgi:NADH:ubiquinone oxidoreductase subunit 5 (subunit L)/multisubunit Na+/H+ antiporter MnhA subunit
VLNNKYYVDEAYNAVIRGGLRVVAWVSYMIDRVLVDGLVIDTLFGRSPRWLGAAGRGLQRGALQGYGLAMALGLALILFIVLWRVMPS